jgi:hypothetical protein
MLRRSKLDFRLNPGKEEKNNAQGRKSAIHRAENLTLNHFNEYPYEDQKALDEVVGNLVTNSMTDIGKQAVKSHVHTSMNHNIIECITICSWIETKPDAYTFFYYENMLADVIKSSTRNISQHNPTFLPKRTFFLNKDHILKRQSKRTSFAGTEVLYDQLIATPNKNSVYIAMCYAYGERYTGLALQKVVNYFLEDLRISPRNIYVYLSPYDQYDLTPAQNAVIEQQQLSTWLRSNQDYITTAHINVIVYKNINIAPHHAHMVSDYWFSTDRYKLTEEIIIDQLMKHSPLNKKFSDAVSLFLKKKHLELSRQLDIAQSPIELMLLKLADLYLSSSSKNVHKGMKNVTEAKWGFNMHLLSSLVSTFPLVIQSSEHRTIWTLADKTSRLFRDYRKKHSYYKNRKTFFTFRNNLLLKHNEVLQHYKPHYLSLIEDFAIQSLDVTIKDEAAADKIGRFIRYMYHWYETNSFSTPVDPLAPAKTGQVRLNWIMRTTLRGMIGSSGDSLHNTIKIPDLIVTYSQINDFITNNGNKYGMIGEEPLAHRPTLGPKQEQGDYQVKYKDKIQTHYKRNTFFMRVDNIITIPEEKADTSPSSSPKLLKKS